MPIMSGYEFVKELRMKAKYANVPVIVMSSVKKVVLNKMYEQLNIQECIQKDNFEQQKFLNIINKYLKQG